MDNKISLKELLERLDKSTDNEEAFIDASQFLQDCNIEYFDYLEADSRLKGYNVISWYCTDSWVGTKAYFLDEEFVCFTHQKGRKSSIENEWASLDSVTKVRDYLFTLMIEEEEKVPNVSVIDWDQKLPTEYQISFSGQFLPQIHKEVIFQGKRYKVTDYRNRGKYLEKRVEIDYDGTPYIINLEDCSIPIPLKEQN